MYTHASMSISSLSLFLLRAKFLTEVIEPNREFVEKQIRKAYKRGIVEVYKPYMDYGYQYDAVSLYPYIMSRFLLPKGKARYVPYIDQDFTYCYKPHFFGFAHVKVYCPPTLYRPFLQIKNNEGILHSPTGYFKGWFYTEELHYAASLGYTFKFIEGYEYDKGDSPFANYINHLEELRFKYPKETPLNKIAKLLMVAIYGRLALKPQESITRIVDTNRVDAYFKTYDSIYNFTPLGKLSIISFSPKQNLNAQLYFLNKKDNKVKQEEELISEYITYKEEQLHDYRAPVHMAAAITALARIHMHKALTKYDGFYTDTDSIFTKHKLPENEVSDSILGRFKLVGTVKNAYFLSTKAYCYTNEKEEQIIKLAGYREDKESPSITIQDFVNLYHSKSDHLIYKNQNLIKTSLLDMSVDIYDQLKVTQLNYKKRQKIFEKSKNWSRSDSNR